MPVLSAVWRSGVLMRATQLCLLQHRYNKCSLEFATNQMNTGASNKRRIGNRLGTKLAKTQHILSNLHRTRNRILSACICVLDRCSPSYPKQWITKSAVDASLQKSVSIMRKLEYLRDVVFEADPDAKLRPSQNDIIALKYLRCIYCIVAMKISLLVGGAVKPKKPCVLSATHDRLKSFKLWFAIRR